MNEMGLIRALGDIDERYIIDARCAHAFTEKKDSRFKSKKWLSVCMAAALMLALAASAFAIGRQWHIKLAEYFKASVSQQETLGSFADYPNACIQENGVSMQIVQTLADTRGIYVLFEITLPENVPVDENIGWGLCSLNVSGAPEDSLVSVGITKTSVLDVTGNKMTVLLHHRMSSAPTAGTAELAIVDICRYDESGAAETVVPGEWKLEWEIAGSGESEVIRTDRDISINDEKVKIEQIEISPFSICVCAAGKDIISDAEVTVEFVDGSSYTYDKHSDGARFVYYLRENDEGGGVNLLFCRFENVVEAEKISGIYLGTAYIPLER